MMSIEEEEDASLKELVTKTLQSNGVLGKIQAQLRASVFLALEEEFRDKAIPLVSPPTRKVLGTREGAVAASLVQDFLQCLGLDFSLAVFVPESGHPSIWSSPGHEALSSSLGLATSKERGGACGDGGEKGQKTPLLIELLRERATPPPSAREQNGEASSVSDNGSSSSREEQEQEQETATHPTDPPPKAPENHVGAKGSAKEGQARAGDCQTPSSLPPLVLENGRKGDEATVRSGKLAGISTTVDASPKLQGLTQLHESKPDSDTSLNGEDKQYEDDFSSMSEKDGRDDDDDDDDDEEEEEEEEEEVEEDIEEDLGDVSVDDLLNSSASGVSDITKDQSLSQASGAPAYQESL